MIAALSLQARCRFGEVVVTALAKSDDAITCRLPPTSLLRAADSRASLSPIRGVEVVSASIDEGQSWFPNADGPAPSAEVAEVAEMGSEVPLTSAEIASSPIKLTRYDAYMTVLSPTTGPAEGGKVVRVHGEGLQPLPGASPCYPTAVGAPLRIEAAANEVGGSPAGGAHCAFGADVRPAVRRGAGWIECELPPAFNQRADSNGVHNALRVPVRIALRGDDWLPTVPGTAPLGFAYFPEPAVRSLFPAGGPAAGGTAVTIRGAFPLGRASMPAMAFAPTTASTVGSTLCRFGGTVVGAVQASSSRVVCLAPPLDDHGIAHDGAHADAYRSASVEVALSFNGGDHVAIRAPPLSFR